MRFTYLFSCLVLTLTSCLSTANAQGELLSIQNTGDLVLFPIEELVYKPEDLIGGDVADPQDWPASFYSSQSSSRCTSTLVGPRVLQTAAHCVGNGRTAQFTSKGETYTSVCTHHPEYRGNSTADYAFCVVDREVKDVPYEVLNQEAGKLKIGQDVLLTGFGCIRPNGSGGNDGKYRIGKAPIIDLPSGNSNDIVTRGSAALCYGDSGGPAFLVDGNERRVISINSRGDIRTTSYLVSLSTDTAKKFIESWSKKNEVKICGVHSDAKGCRGSESEEPPPESSCLDYLAEAIEATQTALEATEEAAACLEKVK